MTTLAVKSSSSSKFQSSLEFEPDVFSRLARGRLPEEAEARTVRRERLEQVAVQASQQRSRVAVPSSAVSSTSAPQPSARKKPVPRVREGDAARFSALMQCALTNGEKTVQHVSAKNGELLIGRKGRPPKHTLALRGTRIAQERSVVLVLQQGAVLCRLWPKDPAEARAWVSELESMAMGTPPPAEDEDPEAQREGTCAAPALAQVCGAEHAAAEAGALVAEGQPGTSSGRTGSADLAEPPDSAETCFCDDDVPLDGEVSGFDGDELDVAEAEEVYPPDAEEDTAPPSEPEGPSVVVLTLEDEGALSEDAEATEPPSEAVRYVEPPERSANRHRWLEACLTGAPGRRRAAPGIQEIFLRPGVGEPAWHGREGALQNDLAYGA